MSELDINRLNVGTAIIERTRRTLGVAAARALWPMLGLPDLGGKDVRNARKSDVEGGGASPPPSSRPASSRALAANARFLRVVEQFVRECCVVSDDHEIQALPLYQAYDAWEARQGRQPMSQTRFGRIMRRAGYKKGKLREIYYYGLRLKAGNGSPSP